jgi:hypothetical protein
MKDPIEEMLDEAGYDDGDLGYDFGDADAGRWDTLDDLGQLTLALSDFASDDDRLADEDMAPFGPIGWNDD